MSVSTRNARLVALRSWFAFAAYRHPEHAALIARVLAIPSKRRDRPLVSFLEPEEADALLKAPGTCRRTGRRDRVLLTFTVQTGEKVVDVVGLYHNPPERAVVLCVDEKSGMQTLDRSQPVLPMMPGMPERRSHDYARHGVTSLFAASTSPTVP